MLLGIVAHDLRIKDENGSHSLLANFVPTKSKINIIHFKLKCIKSFKLTNRQQEPYLKTCGRSPILYSLHSIA